MVRVRAPNRNCWLTILNNLYFYHTVSFNFTVGGFFFFVFVFFFFYSAIFFLDPTLLIDHCFADLNITGNMRTVNSTKTNKLNTDSFLLVHRFE